MQFIKSELYDYNIVYKKLNRLAIGHTTPSNVVKLKTAKDQFGCIFEPNKAIVPCINVSKSLYGKCVFFVL